MSRLARINLAPAGFTGIAASASATSNATPKLTHGIADVLWIKAVGTDSQVKVEYEYSYNDSDWSNAADPADLIGSTKTSFTANQAGWNAINLGLISAPYYRFKVTELGGANSVTVSMLLQVIEES